MRDLYGQDDEEGKSRLRWLDRQLARVNLDRAGAARLALAFVIAVAGSLSFVTLELPLPWFLGSLTFCLVASVLNAPFERPAGLSVPVRAVLGVTVGTAFTPDLLGKVGGMAGSLAILVPFVALITWTGMLYFERVVRWDRPTAFFCAVPGGLTDMISMAQDSGANARTVTLVQATRIVILVFLLPFWLQWTSTHQVSGLPLQGVWLRDFLLVDAAVLLVLGWTGWRLAAAVGLAGAPLVGPMILSGVAHASGLTSARVPVEVLTFAQVTLGILLGAQFRGLTWKEFSTTMMASIGFAFLLLGMTAVVAIIVSRLTGFDSASVLLAYAPGGQTELNLLAYILGLDVAYTALHHLVRLAVVIFGAQLVFRANTSWRQPPGPT